MDVLTLEKVMLAKTIPALGRIVGKKLSEFDDIDNFRRGIITAEGANRSVKICESKEEEITHIIEGIHCYNTDQQEFIDLLNRYGIIGVPQEPVVENTKSDVIDDKTLSESANRIYNAMKMANSGSDMTAEDVQEFVVEHIKKEVKDLLQLP